MNYWMNSDTGRVTFRAYDDPPCGDTWFEISEEEYYEALHPVTTYTQEFDEFSDADPGL